jgi:hypothetical protein
MDKSKIYKIILNKMKQVGAVCASQPGWVPSKFVCSGPLLVGFEFWCRNLNAKLPTQKKEYWPQKF